MTKLSKIDINDKNRKADWKQEIRKLEYFQARIVEKGEGVTKVIFLRYISGKELTKLV